MDLSSDAALTRRGFTQFIQCRHCFHKSYKFSVSSILARSFLGGSLAQGYRRFPQMQNKGIRKFGETIARPNRSISQYCLVTPDVAMTRDSPDFLVPVSLVSRQYYS